MPVRLHVKERTQGLGDLVAWGSTFAFLAVVSGCSGPDDATLALGVSTDLALGFEAERVELVVESDSLGTLAELPFSSDGEPLPSLLELEIPSGVTRLDVRTRVWRRDEPEPFLETQRFVDATELSGERFLPWPIALACGETHCIATQTCLAGRCVDRRVDVAKLGPVPSRWLEEAPDACRSSDSAEATLELGQGVDAFSPWDDALPSVLEPGPQGGHHLWLALRTSGWRQLGSALVVEGRYPELGIALPEMERMVSFRRSDRLGECELFGVRFPIDHGLRLVDVIGRKLVVNALLRSPDGTELRAIARTVLAAPTAPRAERR